ncbi:MAG: Bax inhibitor-1/YccA family protein [Buchananella hordeovulneris]|nr:Bax inhibitor-1/YccA family protein [Buchananella hordeovulneris]
MANPVLSNSKIFGGRETQTQAPNAGQWVQYQTPGQAPTQGGYTQGGYAADYQNGYAPYQQPAGTQPGYAPQAGYAPQPYLGPVAGQQDVMTYEDVTMRTGAMLALVVVAGAISFSLVGSSLGGALTFGGLIAGVVLGLVNAFKREPSPALISAYALAEGLFLGGISGFLELGAPGIVIQAILATVVTFAASLMLYRSGKVRMSGKFKRFMLIALISYAAFSLINFVLVATGLLDNPWGVRGIEVMGVPLGIGIGLIAVLLAAFSLLMDFEAIDRGVASGAPRKYAWSAAFGLLVTLIWLYVEFLRLLAIARD